MELVDSEKLPADFYQTVEKFYLPLADHIASDSEAKGAPLLLGINGAQGTGKSTLTLFLSRILKLRHQRSVAFFSIDDIYLEKSRRTALARDVHPLLATRGVPGTHDVALGMNTVAQLATAEKNYSTAIPVFDKAVDDRLPETQWPDFSGRADIIILEGWCVGSLPQNSADLTEPVNALERERDKDGKWRRYVNEQLAGPYADFFAQIDKLVFVAAPDWRCVMDWRILQEEKLRAALEAQGRDISGLMSATEIAGFIQHYERITRYNLVALPQRADYQLSLDRDHRISALERKT